MQNVKASMRIYIINPLLLFVLLICAYSILMTAVFIPDSKRLNVHIDSAMEIINEEGVYRQPVIAFAGRTDIRSHNILDGSESGIFSKIGKIIKSWDIYSGTTRLDTITDHIMINKLRGNAGLSPFENAFSGYARFWHGYIAYLRPLLTVFDYGTIRYINLLHLTLLIIVVSVITAKKLGIAFSLLIGIVLSMCTYNIFPYSLHFSNNIFIMLYAVLLILVFDKQLIKDNGRVVLFFLLIGSIINFVDFLTVPLLTLGIPLTLCYILKNRLGIYTYKKNIFTVFICSAYWGAGYSLTWIAKWIISYFVEGEFNDLLYSISLRTFGSEEFPINFFVMLGSNIITMYPFILIFLLFITFLILLYFIIKKGKPKKYIWNTSPLLYICILPYVWYLLFANHSQIHYWFTYRIQAITIFALGAFLLNCLDKDKISINTNNDIELAKCEVHLKEGGYKTENFYE